MWIAGFNFEERIGEMNGTEAPKTGPLEALIKNAGAGAKPPVELWNPPYCGDIGLKIARDGTWSYRDSPIGRIAMVKLFASVLRRDVDGRHYVVTPVEKIDVAVEDAPFVAIEMEVQGVGREQSLLFRTNVDDVVTAGPGHPLRFEAEPAGGGLKPYVRVRGGLDALVSRAVYYDLMELVVTSGDQPGTALGLWSGGAFFKLEPLSPATVAATSSPL